MSLTFKVIAFLSLATISICDDDGFTVGNRLRRQANTCKTPSNQQGQCINIQSCQPLLDLLSNEKRSPAQTSLLQKSFCGYENDRPKVCCTRQQTSGPGPSSQPPANPQQQSNECGISTVNVNKIVGGRAAKLRAWPWMALIGYNSMSKPQWNCGGTLVNARHVVTAAHCILNKRLTVVRLGELDYNTIDDKANHVDIPVEKAFSHPQYNPSRRLSDIGIVKLREAARFNADVQPICLPSSAELRSKNVDGLSLFIAGWGSFGYKSNQYPSQLYEAQVDVMSNQECASAYAKIRASSIDETVLCAGGSTTDSCQGDSGGPLMIPIKKNYHLIGVISYGHKCAEPGFPGVYTRVTEFVDWIQANI
ncbi:hypothetical protein LSTR_LSTR009032 [Laodelphax striatellus]|uniref:CLIP domain-containing serine protease n=1 Tax=Laodelphax striatellus TaxID=195883 RepID=A0A482XCL3_LAOST|nr:hypothetical protein LSTR_LSTR009032 [Laodelphax striatellus]